ncbi:hypothetical protein K1T71_000632 [Dendrolimus kikuchii]|uniref:Uncharacterized protein n=1 Tax=Dendrolimus kikuchii TaxID=765133 RepID=A0ACC1DKF2_9NEOP|nr:hypothetical protein K1T71_000632 [Dendrolimus kikuchii]
MNAEAKKKVDVLSEELLPYIIAEQERRTTLYKRVMTAIQNGEKGVTIAEIRNKPPLIIRKGLMYRCPANRAPKEPDGSGMIMCEDDIEPTPVMYDSCLSAEDKELYVAENRYFFCNRHKVEGPDLPRNGSTVIGCAPIERTSLNYTTSRCALEDTDDVVVHYRYYPDKTYKFVTEMDPDHEVCDHWNPCQIGYIYSLPSPDQAVTANELWQDNINEYVPVNAKNYKTSPRKLLIPEGYEYHGIGKYLPNEKLQRLSSVNKPSRRKHSGNGHYLRDDEADSTVAPEGTAESEVSTAPGATETDAGSTTQAVNGASQGADPTGSSASSVSKRTVYKGPLTIKATVMGKYLSIVFEFSAFNVGYCTSYYVRFVNKLANRRNRYKYVRFLTLNAAATFVEPKTMHLIPSGRFNATSIDVKCRSCTLKGVMIRGLDGAVFNLDSSKFSMKPSIDLHGKPSKVLELDLNEAKPQDFGDYFAIIQSEDGTEERIKIISILSLKAPLTKESLTPGSHFDKNIKYQCGDCEVYDITCNGESVISAPGARVSITPHLKLINFNFPSFEEINACVYIVLFKRGIQEHKRILAVLEKVTITEVKTVPPPADGEQFEQEVQYSCSGTCTVDKVSVNGIILDAQTRRAGGAYAFYLVSDNSITIRITEYNEMYEGMFQAVFNTGTDLITKNILEIKDPAQKETKAEEGSSGSPNNGTGGDAKGAEGDKKGAEADDKATTIESSEATTVDGAAEASTEAPAPP